jgi:hypothetical protein
MVRITGGIVRVRRGRLPDGRVTGSAGMIDIGDMNDNEIFAIAVSWSALKTLPPESSSRAIYYLSQRLRSHYIEGKESIDEMLQRFEMLIAQAKTEGIIGVEK